MTNLATKPLAWQAVEQPPQLKLLLIGELSRNTLLPLWQQRDVFLANKLSQFNHVCWDLSQLTRIDSAGFAFLCELLHQSQQQAQQVTLQSVPSQVLTLSELMGLKNWIQSFLI